MKKRNVSSFLFFAVVAALLTLGFQYNICNAVETLNIGVVLPLSGSTAHDGEQHKLATSYAALQMNEKGGLNIGGSKYKINLIYYDSRCIPTEAVNATNRLITKDGVKFIIGDVCSSCSAAMMDFCEKAKVIQISPQSSAPVLTSTGKKYIFATNFTSEQWEIPLAKWAITEMKWKTWALLSMNNAFGKPASKAYMDTIESLGGKILANQYFEDGTTDFYPALTKIKALNPDAFRMICTHEPGTLIIKQFRELGLKCAITGYNSHSTVDFIRDVGPAVVNGIYTNSHPPETPMVEEYARNVMRIYGKHVEDVSRMGYDTMNILAMALEKSGTVNDTDKVREALLKTDYEGLNGHLTFAPNGRVRMKIWVRTVKDGKQVWIKGLSTD